MLKALSHGNDRADHDISVFVGQLADKGLVNLQYVNGKPAKIVRLE